jgi:hypothetical protein
MCTIVPSKWQLIAAQRWPQAAAAGRVQGDGPYALTVACTQRAYLFHTKEDRQRKMIRMDFGCGSANCTGAHKYTDLQVRHSHLSPASIALDA